jgi:hypothetical protein
MEKVNGKDNFLDEREEGRIILELILDAHTVEIRTGLT